MDRTLTGKERAVIRRSGVVALATLALLVEWLSRDLQMGREPELWWIPALLLAGSVHCAALRHCGELPSTNRFWALAQTLGVAAVPLLAGGLVERLGAWDLRSDDDIAVAFAVAVPLIVATVLLRPGPGGGNQPRDDGPPHAGPGPDGPGGSGSGHQTQPSGTAAAPDR